MTDEKEIDRKESEKYINKMVLDRCKKLKIICYQCPECKMLTSGLMTSYHAQLHGDQEIYYNPLP